VLFAATLLVRAPVFLFQGVAAHLLPNLTTFQAGGDHARVRRATVVTATVLASASVVLATAALLGGPAVMQVMFGTGFDAAATDLALLALGVGGFLAAGTFCQALLARDRAGRAACSWVAATGVFLAVQLSLSGSGFHRVSVAFAAASALVAILLSAAVWRHES
jgi:O-antigen/teichoic acid export membrane protein